MAVKKKQVSKITRTPEIICVTVRTARSALSYYDLTIVWNKEFMLPNSKKDFFSGYLKSFYEKDQLTVPYFEEL